VGTKELRSQNTWIFRTRFLALTLSVASLGAAATAGCTHAARQGRACQSILDLNREALLSYEEADFEAAEKSLTKALKVSKQANLGGGKLTARTYLQGGRVHLSSLGQVAGRSEKPRYRRLGGVGHGDWFRHY
jgi:hypothetical protein